jgi:hypothetical protein
MTVTGLAGAVSVTLVILLAAFGSGYLLLRALALDPEQGLWEWLALALGLGLLAQVTLLFGWVGLLNPWLFGVLYGGLAIAGVRQIWLVRPRRIPAWPAALSMPERPFLIVLFGLATATVVWVLLTRSLLPPIDWDVLAYHLALPQLYLDAGRIGYVSFNVTSNWPLGFEMLFLNALLFGSDIAAHLIMLACTILIAAGLWLFGREIGGVWIGPLAATAFLLAPLVQRLGGVAMIDVGMGLYVLGAAVTFEFWQRRRRDAWLLLCGLFCGSAASTKLMGGGVAILYGLLLIGVILREGVRDGAGWRVLVSELWRRGLPLVSGGVVLVAPWYLRSYVNTGNPIWPFAYNLFGGRNWDALGDEYHHQVLYEVWTVGLPDNPIGLLQSFFVVLMRPEDLGGYGGGLGLPLLLGALFAAIVSRKAPRPVQQALLIAAGFWVLWFVLVSRQVRYLLPVAPLLALAAGWLIHALRDWLRRPTLQAVLLAAVVLLLARDLPWADADARGLTNSRWPYLSGAQSRSAFLDQQIDLMPLIRQANTTLPSDALILLLPFETRSYYLERDYIWGNLMSQRVIRFEQYRDAEALHTDLQALGVTHLIESPTWIYPELRYWQQDRALMLDLQRRCADTLMRDGEHALFVLAERCRS